MLKINFDTALVELVKVNFAHITVERAVADSNLLLDGKFAVGKDFQAFDYNVDNIDWDINVSASYSRHVHMLMPVYIPAYAYYNTNDERYLILAYKIVLSWLGYERKAEQQNPNVWHYISVTGRVTILAFLAMLQMAKDNTERPDLWLSGLIYRQCQWLMQKENYKRKSSSGMAMDIALIVAGVYQKDDAVIRHGVTGFLEQLAHAFPKGTAHFENSASKHADMFWRLLVPFYFVEKLELPEAKEISKYKDGISNFLSHLVTPKAEIVAAGSSYTSFFHVTDEILGKCEMTGHLNLLYALTKGEKGEKPTEKIRIYQLSGYGFFRSSWDADKFDTATWLCFKAGFSNAVYKHCDDLSVCLVAKGVNVFIDPGMYNDTKGNMYQDYLQSAFAHSGIIVDNKSYPLGQNLQYKAGFFPVTAKKEGKSDKLRGYNNLYPGVFIDRTIIYADEYEFYIVDDVFSEEEHEYAQNFHLSNEVTLAVHTSKFSVIKLDGTEWNVCILQHDAVDKISMKAGKTGDITTTSIQGTAKNKAADTTSIQYTKKGKRARFVTAVKIARDDEIDIVLEEKSPLNDNRLLIYGEKIYVSPRQRALPVEVDIIYDSGQLLLAHAEAEVAYHLLNKNSGKHLTTAKYTKEISSALAVPGDGSYIIRALRRMQKAEVTKWCVGEIKINNGSFEYKPTPINKSIPYVKDRLVYINGTNLYEYELILADYPYPYEITWNINRNGKKYFSEKGGSKLSYKFLEQGMYTCCYTVSTKYFGIIESGNFPETDMTVLKLQQALINSYN